MSDISLVVARPAQNLELVLETEPVKTRSVQLQAFLFDGEDDVSRRAKFSWYLSWKGSYRTYSRRIATGFSVITQLTLGGERLTVLAVYQGSRHRVRVPLKVTGTNPSSDQVAKAIGDDDVLKALC